MADALFIVPTVYARIGRLRTFLDACQQTRRGDTDIMLALDEEELGDWAPFLVELEDCGPPWVFPASAPRMPLGPKMNRHAGEAMWGWPRVGFLADDTVPVTEGWDVKLTDALKTPGIAYARSNRRNDIPEHHLVSSVILRALGWYWEPGLRHYYADNVLGALGAACGCLRYVPAAEIRHDHWESAAVEHDETYRVAEERGAEDKAAYLAWASPVGRGRLDVAKVRKALREWAG